MTNQDRKQFAQVCALMSQAFDKEMSELLISVYFDALKDLDIQQVKHAVEQAIRTKTFMPKVAELRELVEGGATDKAELAWRTFVDLVKFEGCYPSLQVYDGAIAYAIECMGGWQAACEKLAAASPEMIANHEKTFKASYKLGLQRHSEPQYIVGAVEVNNRTLGAGWKTPTVSQPVCLVRLGAVVKVIMPLDVVEGRLTAEARQALADGGNAIQKYLPAPTAPVKVLNPAPDAEMATPEEVAELLGKRDAIANRALRLVPKTR